MRRHLTYANVTSTIALVIAVGGGAAYAADTIGSSDIINESILSEDLKNGEVKTDDLATDAATTSKIRNGAVHTADLDAGAVTGVKILDANIFNADLANGSVDASKLQDGSVTSAKVLDDTRAGGGLSATDLTANSVAQSEIATDGVAALEIQDNSIDSGEIVDFQLTNQDIGVLFAEVNADGTLANSSGGTPAVTSTRVGAAGGGTYEVDFGRNVTVCTAVASLGSSTTGVATGEVSAVDRSINVEAVFVDTNTSAGAAADRPFRLVVVC